MGKPWITIGVLDSDGNSDGERFGRNKFGRMDWTNIYIIYEINNVNITKIIF